MLKRILALVAFAVVLVCSPLQARADDTGFAIADGVNVTGMASDASRGVYWVTDEAGGAVRAISSSGQTLGTLTYQATTQSVQALSLSRGSLYVGDIGGSRTTVRLIKLGSLAYGAVQSQSWQLTYPDGAHEARALMVSPKGNVYLVTSGTKPGVYRLSNQLSTTATNKLVRVADAPADVTDATFLASGNAVVMRTPDQVLVVDAYKWTTTASAYVLPQASGQGLATGLTSQSVLLADAAQIATTAIPTTISTVRPSPSPTPEESPTGTVEPTTEASTGSAAPSLRGTFIALAAAVGLSVVAALVVALRK